MCVSQYVCAHVVPWCEHGGQNTACKNLFSPPCGFLASSHQATYQTPFQAEPHHGPSPAPFKRCSSSQRQKCIELLAQDTLVPGSRYRQAVSSPTHAPVGSRALYCVPLLSLRTPEFSEYGSPSYPRTPQQTKIGYFAR